MAIDRDKMSSDAILTRFRRGALLDDEGNYYREREKCDEGHRLIRQSLKELDSIGPHAREELIPLLNDASPIIRVWAAAALVKVIPDRALAVLEEIRDRSLSDANGTASNLLILHEQGRLNY